MVKKSQLTSHEKQWRHRQWNDLCNLLRQQKIPYSVKIFFKNESNIKITLDKQIENLLPGTQIVKKSSKKFFTL